MGLFDFKSKPKKFKYGKKEYPEFTTKEALPNDDTIRIYYWYYVLDGRRFQTEKEVEEKAKVIGEKIYELYKEGKINTEADWFKSARKRFFPTDEDINQMQQQVTLEFDKNYKKVLERILDNLLSDKNAMTSVYYLLYGDFNGAGQKEEERIIALEYARQHFNELIDVIFSGLEYEKSGNNKYFSSFYILRDLVYLKNNGYEDLNKDIEHIYEYGIMDDIPICCKTKQVSSKKLDYSSILEQVEWCKRIESKKLDKWQAFLDEMNHEAKKYIFDITKENYLEVITSILSKEKQASQALKQSREDFANGITLCEEYIDENELKEGLHLIESAANAGNEEAILWLLKYKADTGDAHAQYLLSQSYKEGINGCQRNDELAREWLVRSARNNDAQAIYDIGYSYFEKQPDQAMKYFNRLALRNEILGYSGLTEVHLKNESYEEAFKANQKVLSYPKCSYNIPSILNAMGYELKMLQLNQSNLPNRFALENFKRVIDFVELAMDRKNGNELYDAYLQVKRNPTIESLRKLSSAINAKNFKYKVNNFNNSPFWLAISCVEVGFWHEEAEKGNKDAYLNLKNFYRGRNNTKSVYWAKKALDANIPFAYYDAAHYPYEYGLELDLEERYAYLQRAAKMGNQNAKDELFLQKEELKNQLRQYKATLENDSLDVLKKKDELERIERNIIFNMTGEAKTLNQAEASGDIPYSEFIKINDIKEMFLKN